MVVDAVAGWRRQMYDASGHPSWARPRGLNSAGGAFGGDWKAPSPWLPGVFSAENRLRACVFKRGPVYPSRTPNVSPCISVETHTLSGWCALARARIEHVAGGAQLGRFGHPTPGCDPLHPGSQQECL